MSMLTGDIPPKKKVKKEAERKKQESEPAGTTGVRAETEAGPMEFHGISLVDLLNLVYLGTDEIEPEKQLGTIIMEFQSGCKYLYSEWEVDMTKPTIKYGDTIIVRDTGPICSFEELDFEFDLFCGTYKGSIKVKFDPFPNEVYFEERRIRSVDCNGQICAVFGCFSNATVANLEIKFVNISAATNVHGVVAARNSQLDQPSCTSVLFWKSSANKIEVGLDGVIPLRKPCVGVPLDSEFYVDIYLNVDGDVYTDTASFIPQTEGSKFAEVPNPEKETKIIVKVKWDSRKNSVFSTYDYLYRKWDEDEYDSEEDTEGLILMETLP